MSTARRMLITCWGSYGDVFPYIGLAIALKERGHQPVVAVPAYYQQAVEQAGVEFTPVGVDADPSDRAVMARVMHPVKGSEAVIREFVVPALRHTYDQLHAAAADADVVVSHPLTFAAPLVAEIRRIPLVSTILAPLGFFSVTDLPVLPPAPWAIHLRALGQWFGAGVVAISRAATRAWVAPVGALRAELGLPAAEHPLFAGQFSTRLNLALFSSVMAQPQRDWPPRTQVTGFVFYNGPSAALDPALEAFLADGEPPVVFTLGTSAVGAAGTFYQESVAAVRALGVRAVLLTGSYAENRPEDLPPGVLAVERAPHQLLFPRASAVVHQGGIGTTAQALRGGRPMLVVPHGHDQPDNAFRVTNLGVARTLFPQRYRADRVTRELDTLLGTASYGARAAEIAAVVRSERGADAAAEAIGALV